MPFYKQIHVRSAGEGASGGIPGGRAGVGRIPVLLARGRGVEAVRQRAVLPLGSTHRRLNLRATRSLPQYNAQHAGTLETIRVETYLCCAS